MKVGLREANLHFSKYVRFLKAGEKIVLTERGVPIGVIRPVAKDAEGLESRLKSLEDQGILRRASRGKMPLPRPISLRGKPLSKVAIEGREERF